jgi:hypothetical protein
MAASLRAAKLNTPESEWGRATLAKVRERLEKLASDLEGACRKREADLASKVPF